MRILRRENSGFVALDRVHAHLRVPPPLVSSMFLDAPA